jgi:hypothetical protein
VPRLPAILVTGDDPPHLRRAGYLGHVGEDFTVAARRGGTKTLRLVEIADLAGLDGRDDAFSLVFSGPRGIGSGIRTFRHSALGTIQLFVSPVGPHAHRGTYEAIVNRSRGVRRSPRPRPRPSR